MIEENSEVLKLKAEIAKLKVFINDDAVLKIEQLEFKMNLCATRIKFAQDGLKNKWRGEGITTGAEHMAHVQGCLDSAREILKVHNPTMLASKYKRALQVLNRHHKWHQEYDEVDGYPDSDLEIATTDVLLGEDYSE